MKIVAHGFFKSPVISKIKNTTYLTHTWASN
jgi:hypothetical protein